MSQSTDIRQGTIIRIVDDDEDIRDSLSFMLECKGWQVRTYGSARDFLTQDSPSIPGCLLLDIRMPDMDGLDLAQYLYEHCPDTRMILISGHGEFEYAQRALQYQVTDYILKPITRAKLNSLEDRLCAIQKELSADVPPWYACDEELRTRVSEALHRGDMAAMGELLISKEVFRSLSDRRDVLGIQLLNYLFLYQDELGKDRTSLDAMRQKSMVEYWKLTTQQERLAYLAAQYYDLMEYAETCKGEYSNPIISYCLRAIRENYHDSNFNISNLADTLHLSLSYLSTVFKNVTGQNISSYLSSQRQSRARELLRDPSIPIRDVCSASGYDDPRYFAKVFKKHTGMTPSEFRNLYAGGALEAMPGEEELP